MKLSNGMKGLALSGVAAAISFAASIFSKRNQEELTKKAVEEEVAKKLAELEMKPEGGNE